MEKSEILKNVLIAIISINSLFIIGVIAVVVRNSKMNKQFKEFLDKNGFKLNVLERDLKEVTKDLKTTYGELIYTKVVEIVMQCEDYRKTPFQFLESEMLFIKTNKNLTRNQKLILMNTLIIGFHYLIKEQKEIFDLLEQRDFQNELVVSFTINNLDKTLK